MTTVEWVVLFAVCLLVSNLLTFYVSVKRTAKVVSKMIEDGLVRWTYSSKDNARNYYSWKNSQQSKGIPLLDYIFADRLDAEKTLTTLTEIAERYGMASVADYYDLIKVESKFTDNSYGWGSFYLKDNTKIIPVRDGFIIGLPTPEVL